MLMTGNQLKAARALAGVEQLALAETSGLSVGTIRNMEAQGPATLKSGLATIAAVQRALEAVGVEFLNHGQPGVRLVKPELLVNGQPVRPIAYSTGDQVQFITGREDKPELRGKIGLVCEIEASPIRMGPVPRIRVRFDTYETGFHMPSMFKPA